MFELLSNGECHFLHDSDLSIPLKELAECKNYYSGSVFLLASGASAGEFPVSRYGDFPFIAMNGSILRLVDEKISPLFYMCTDSDFPRERPGVARLGCEYAQHIAMNLESYSEIHSYNKTTLLTKSLYLLSRINRHYDRKHISDRRFAWSIRRDPELISNFSLFRNKQNSIGFSKNVVRGYFGGRTVVYTALQFAYTLGFQNVFIVGLDLKKEAGRFYEHASSAISTPLGGMSETGHDGTKTSHEQHREVSSLHTGETQGSNMVLPTSIDVDYRDNILPSFQIFSKEVLKKQKKFKVFNLSLNSRLPDSVIPKITLDQLDQLLFQHETIPLRTVRDV